MCITRVLHLNSWLALILGDRQQVATASRINSLSPCCLTHVLGTIQLSLASPFKHVISHYIVTQKPLVQNKLQDQSCQYITIAYQMPTKANYQRSISMFFLVIIGLHQLNVKKTIKDDSEFNLTSLFCLTLLDIHTFCCGSYLSSAHGRPLSS